MDQKTNYFANTEFFVKEVIDCSSQYGEDGRTAFVAENLSGPPTVYPNYEDSTRSCAFLRYGTRWESHPGSLNPITDGTPMCASTDYVDVFFERPLIVLSIKIYETFFPGAIVAVRACYRDQPSDLPVNARGMYWATLWECPRYNESLQHPSIDGDKSIVPSDYAKSLKLGKARVFEPLLYNIPLVLTDIIRIELDVRRCAYHTQLDAVRVRGYEPISDEEAIRRQHNQSDYGVVSRKKLEWYISYLEEQNNERRLITSSYSPIANGPYVDEIDDCPAQLLALPRSSVDIANIQNSAICPISMALEHFPSRLTSSPTLMQQRQVAIGCDNHLNSTRNHFSRLPYIIRRKIFDFFDLRTLCRISSVCRDFQHLADATLSSRKEVNLQSLWPTVTDNSLAVLGRRLCKSRSRTKSTNEASGAQYASFRSVTGTGVTHCTTLISGGPAVLLASSERTHPSDVADSEGASQTRLRRLDLSWCGNYHSISPLGFCFFLNNIGRNLTTLRLASCQMINDECLLHLINVCGQLEELDLSSCRSITRSGFIPLGRLISLRWVGLYRTRVADAALHNLANLCQHLRHLDLGACGAIEDADAVVDHLTATNPLLESLILWRCRNLSGVGVLRVSEHCPHLQRLDLGWCTDIVTEPTNCLRELVSRCRKLKVLTLAAVRSVTPSDVDAIAENLADSLVDLDLVGNALITQPCVDRLLSRCRHLAFLDISHCPSISVYEALSLRAAHPHCNVVFHQHTLLPPSPSPSPPSLRVLELPSPERIMSPLALPSPRVQQMDVDDDDNDDDDDDDDDDDEEEEEEEEEE